MASSLTPEGIERLARWRRDPVAFGLEFLGRKAYTPDQERILRAVAEHDNVAVHSCHGGGKTAAAADLAYWWLITRRPSIVVTTAPTHRQVNRVLWKEIRKLHTDAGLKRWGVPGPQKEPYLEVAADHFAIGVSTDEPVSFQGFHSPYILAVIDEAAGVAPMIWEQVGGITSSIGAKKLAIGNPTEPSGIFYDVCRSSAWHTIHVSAFNHPNVLEQRNAFPGMVSQKFIDETIEVYGRESPYYISRVLGEFPEEGSDTLISLKWVREAMERAPPERPAGHAPELVIGVDVARYGDNETVIVLLEDRQITRMIHHTGKSLTETCGRIVRLKEECRNDPGLVIAIDDDGIGGGLTDFMAAEGHQVRPFRGGEKARNEKHFFNKRAEAWWAMREVLRSGQFVLPQDERLKSQLASVKYEIRPSGQTQLEKKEDMLKRGVTSPDRADAVVIAWWAMAPRLAAIDQPEPARERKARGGWRSEFNDVAGLPGRRGE